MTYVLVLLGILTPQCEYVVSTYSGNEYVIGVGDTCADAWEGHGTLPEDWRSITVRWSYVYIDRD